MHDVDIIRELIETLEAEGLDVRTDYSGRCMYGARCLGVTVDHSGAIFQLGQLLHEFDWLGEPRTDNMGRDVIVYWPDVDTKDYNKAQAREDYEENMEEGDPEYSQL